MVKVHQAQTAVSMIPAVTLSIQLQGVNSACHEGVLVVSGVDVVTVPGERGASGVVVE